uniref:AB hydrolase-1 domain-containing protein n=1 Tax=Leucosporidium scottii TaxID=5278 RepID=A0A0H5FUX8_9BASI
MSSSTRNPGPSETSSAPITSTRTGPRGHPADLLYWPCLGAEESTGTSAPPSPGPSLVLLFIPGNPGLPHYYNSFMSSLQAALPPPVAARTAIYALGHLGHSPAYARWKQGETAPGLQEQVDDKVKFVDELKEKWDIGVGEGQTKVVLLGHSIGAWVCCETLKQRPNLISQSIHLFPTISHMALTPNGKVLWPLFSPIVSLPVGLATGALSYLPIRPLTKLVSLLAAQSGQPAEVTTSLVSSPATVRAALTMAAEEMKEVTRLDEGLLKEYGGKMWWYWARDGLDGWVAESSVVEIEGVLDEAGHGKAQRERCGEGMKHAFCLRQDHADSLAKKVAGWVDRAHA